MASRKLTEGDKLDSMHADILAVLDEGNRVKVFLDHLRAHPELWKLADWEPMDFRPH
jgi:hypothetical protein